MPETFPTDWRESDCAVVLVPFPLVPYVTGLLKIMENRGFWLSDDDYLNGYTAVYELERCFMSTCASQLLESNDRLYRMLDTALFGVGYTVESTDPLVVTPAIPPQRTLGIYDEGSVLGRIDDLQQLLQNALNGTETPHYDAVPGIRALLQSIIDALGADDTDLEAILSQLELVVGLLA